jgi:hypothetical protein
MARRLGGPWSRSGRDGEQRKALARARNLTTVVQPVVWLVFWLSCPGYRPRYKHLQHTSKIMYNRLTLSMLRTRYLAYKRWPFQSIKETFLGVKGWYSSLGDGREANNPSPQKIILLRNVSKRLGPGLILWYDLSNGKRTWDLVHGTLGVSVG